METKFGKYIPQHICRYMGKEDLAFGFSPSANTGQHNAAFLRMLRDQTQEEMVRDRKVGTGSVLQRTQYCQVSFSH